MNRQEAAANAVAARKKIAARRRHEKWAEEMKSYGWTVNEPKEENK